MCGERITVHGLAALRAADLQPVTAGRRAPEVVIEGDDTVNLGTRQIEPACDMGDRCRRHVAEFTLHLVQHLEQRTGAGGIRRDDRIDSLARSGIQCRHADHRVAAQSSPVCECPPPPRRGQTAGWSAAAGRRPRCCHA